MSTFDEAARFLAVSPRPKLRKHRGAVTRDALVVHVTEDRERQKALLRGLDLRPILDAAGVLDRVRWSVAAKGWVIQSADLADVVAMAEYAGRRVRVKIFGDHAGAR
jgi:hypothetical protein